MKKNLNYLLRYHGRHRVWFPRGYKGWIMPRLNPLESCSHAGNKRTFGFYEPMWVWRVRQRLFTYAGPANCSGAKADWHRGIDGNRTCSYCGSIHYFDLLEIAAKSIYDDMYGVEGTQKSYKMYVRQPGVRNAGEGAIKFYTYHLPETVSEKSNAILNEALRVTQERWAARYKVA